jgi:hypothetical protein
MAGETNLTSLLKSMAPSLLAGEYVFVSFANAQYGDHANLQPIAMVHEVEGVTLVVPRDVADEHGLAYHAVFCCITLTVHSSLEAVGLTAAVSAQLASRDISANVVAGYYHDHIFVPAAQAAQAMALLSSMAS